jgi:hypothetical protein
MVMIFVQLESSEQRLAIRRAQDIDREKGFYAAPVDKFANRLPARHHPAAHDINTNPTDARGASQQGRARDASNW